MATIMTIHIPVNTVKLVASAYPAMSSDIGTPSRINNPIFCTWNQVRYQAAPVSAMTTDSRPRRISLSGDDAILVVLNCRQAAMPVFV